MSNLVKRLSPDNIDVKKIQTKSKHQWLPNSRSPIHLEFGSYHQQLRPSPKQVRIEVNGQQTQALSSRWTLFFSMDRLNAKLCERYIQKVTYRFHKSHGLEPITVTNAPFILSRVNFQTRHPITAQIVFQSWSQLKPITLEHTLDFSKKENIHSYYIERGSFKWDVK
jgi:hypothetical protein